MKITCIDKQVGKLLGEGFYSIPRFQRPYSWDRTNVEEFWNDVVVDNESDYFIGNFVVYENGETFGIVDGQQRLTTLTLLLCALRNAYAKSGFVKLANGIHGLIERPNLESEKLYVLQTSSSYPFFQDHIQKFPGPPDTPVEPGQEEKLLQSAFFFFESQIDATTSAISQQTSLSPAKKKATIEKELTRIRNKVISLKLIFTALTNDDDAYVIFETLNTRGKDLTLSDLVKGHLSRLIPSHNKGVDLTKDKWDKIAATFDESQADLSVSTFVHHFWLSKYDYVTEKKLYKILRKQITKVNAKEFLNDLVTESALYRQIFEPSYRKWKKEELPIRDSLSAMNLFRIKQQVPMTLCLLRLYDSGDIKLQQLMRTLQAIEDFHFAFTAITSQRSSGGISFMYASAAKNMFFAKGPQRASKLNEFREKLSSKVPSYGEFVVSFVDLKYSSTFSKEKPLVRYILQRLYEYNSSGLSLDMEKATIEHVAPENVKAGNTKLAPETVANIGNLILVNQELNKKLNNKPFLEKRDILQKSGVWVDPILLSATEWGAKQIEERAEAMAKQSYGEVWSLA